LHVCFLFIGVKDLISPAHLTVSRKNSLNLEVVRLIFQKIFEFPLPSREEIKAVKQIAESNPDDLDGRDLWVLQEFVESDFE